MIIHSNCSLTHDMPPPSPESKTGTDVLGHFRALTAC
jgi:hypothetical protein